MAMQVRVLSCRCHHQQEVSFFLFNAFEHRANRPDLAITTSNRSVDELLRQRLSIASYIGEAFQVVASGNPDYFAWGGVFQIPEIKPVPVGLEAERQFTAQLLLNVVAILLGQFTVYSGIPTSTNASGLPSLPRRT